MHEIAIQELKLTLSEKSQWGYQDGSGLVMPDKAIRPRGGLSGSKTRYNTV